MDSKASFNKLYNYLTLVGEYFKINYYHKKIQITQNKRNISTERHFHPSNSPVINSAIALLHPTI